MAAKYIINIPRRVIKSFSFVYFVLLCSICYGYDIGKVVVVDGVNWERFHSENKIVGFVPLSDESSSGKFERKNGVKIIKSAGSEGRETSVEISQPYELGVETFELPDKYLSRLLVPCPATQGFNLGNTYLIDDSGFHGAKWGKIVHEPQPADSILESETLMIPKIENDLYSQPVVLIRSDTEDYYMIVGSNQGVLQVVYVECLDFIESPLVAQNLMLEDSPVRGLMLTYLEAENDLCCQNMLSDINGLVIKVMDSVGQNSYLVPLLNGQIKCYSEAEALKIWGKKKILPIPEKPDFSIFVASHSGACDHIDPKNDYGRFLDSDNETGSEVEVEVEVDSDYDSDFE